VAKLSAVVVIIVINAWLAKCLFGGILWYCKQPWCCEIDEI